MKKFYIKSLFICLMAVMMSISVIRVAKAQFGIAEGYVFNFESLPIQGLPVNITIDTMGVNLYNSVTQTDSSGYYSDTISIYIPSGTGNVVVKMTVTDCSFNSFIKIQEQKWEFPYQWLPPFSDMYICDSVKFLCDAGLLSFPWKHSITPTYSPGEPADFMFLIANNGLDSSFFLSPIAIGYILNGGTPVLSSLPTNYFLDSFSVDTILTSTTYGIPSPTLLPGNNTLCFFVTNLPCDTNNTNDTVCAEFYTAYSSQVPYFDNFDSISNLWYTTDSSIWQAGTPNSTIINQAYSGVNSWATVLSGNYPNNSEAYLHTPAFTNFPSLSNLDTMILSFYHYVAVSDSGDYGTVQYSLDNGSTWHQLGGINDPLGTNWYNDSSSGVEGFYYYNSGWVQSSYKLDPNIFNGNDPVRFRFLFVSDGSVNSDGWAIDDFRIEDTPFKPVRDVGISSIINPTGAAAMGSQIYPSVMIENYGTAVETNIPLIFRVQSGNQINQNPLEIWQGTLLPGDSVAYTFNNPYTVPSLNYDLFFSTYLPNDSCPGNDTLVVQMTGTPALGTLPYSVDFDPMNDFWYTDTSAIWQHGIPTANIINTAYSGNKVWTTILDGDYPNNANVYLYTPIFNFSSLGINDTMEISFYHWLALEPDHKCRVEFSVNGGQTWSNLGFVNDPNGINWYNVQQGGNHYFSMANSGWMYSAIILDVTTFNGNPLVQFRFNFVSTVSGTSDGWAIDSFNILTTSPIPNAEVTNIIFPVNDTLPGTTISPTVEITNFSYNPIIMHYIVPLELKLDGIIIAQETASFFLPSSPITTYTFFTPYTVPIGAYQLCSRTNFFPVNIPGADFCRNFPGTFSTSGHIYGMLSAGSVAAGPSLVYLIEHDSLLGTLTAIDTTLSSDTAGVTSYHFTNVPPGNYLIKAALTNYNPLYTNYIPTYHQSSLFWNLATTVNTQPGIITQASINIVPGINPGGPGFIGGLISQGANKSPGDPIEGVQLILLDADDEDNPVAYTYSVADGTFSFTNIGHGIYKVYAEMLNKTTIPAIVTIDSNNLIVDNIHLVVSSNVISPVEETEEHIDIYVSKLFPNPATERFHLTINSPNHGIIHTEIYDITGKAISKRSDKIFAGKNQIEFDSYELKRGMYFIKVTLNDGFVISRKLIITE